MWGVSGFAALLLFVGTTAMVGTVAVSCKAIGKATNRIAA
jgi:hypothetical protein